MEKCRHSIWVDLGQEIWVDYKVRKQSKCSLLPLAFCWATRELDLPQCLKLLHISKRLGVRIGILCQKYSFWTWTHSLQGSQLKGSILWWFYLNVAWYTCLWQSNSWKKTAGGTQVQILLKSPSLPTDCMLVVIACFNQKCRQPGVHLKLAQLKWRTHSNMPVLKRFVFKIFERTKMFHKLILFLANCGFWWIGATGNACRWYIHCLPFFFLSPITK